MDAEICERCGGLLKTDNDGGIHCKQCLEHFAKVVRGQLNPRHLASLVQIGVIVPYLVLSVILYVSIENFVDLDSMIIAIFAGLFFLFWLINRILRRVIKCPFCHSDIEWGSDECFTCPTCKLKFSGRNSPKRNNHSN